MASSSSSSSKNSGIEDAIRILRTAEKFETWNHSIKEFRAMMVTANGALIKRKYISFILGVYKDASPSVIQTEFMSDEQTKYPSIPPDQALIHIFTIVMNTVIDTGALVTFIAHMEDTEKAFNNVDTFKELLSRVYRTISSYTPLFSSKFHELTYAIESLYNNSEIVEVRKAMYDYLKTHNLGLNLESWKSMLTSCIALDKEQQELFAFMSGASQDITNVLVYLRPFYNDISKPKPSKQYVPVSDDDIIDESPSPAPVKRQAPEHTFEQNDVVPFVIETSEPSTSKRQTKRQKTASTAKPTKVLKRNPKTKYETETIVVENLTKVEHRPIEVEDSDTLDIVLVPGRKLDGFITELRKIFGSKEIKKLAKEGKTDKHVNWKVRVGDVATKAVPHKALSELPMIPEMFKKMFADVGPAVTSIFPNPEIFSITHAIKDKAVKVLGSPAVSQTVSKVADKFKKRTGYVFITPQDEYAGLDILFLENNPPNTVALKKKITFDGLTVVFVKIMDDSNSHPNAKWTLEMKTAIGQTLYPIILIEFKYDSTSSPASSSSSSSSSSPNLIPTSSSSSGLPPASPPAKKEKKKEEVTLPETSDFASKQLKQYKERLGYFHINTDGDLKKRVDKFIKKLGNKLVSELKGSQKEIFNRLLALVKSKTQQDVLSNVVALKEVLNKKKHPKIPKSRSAKKELGKLSKSAMFNHLKDDNEAEKEIKKYVKNFRKSLGDRTIEQLSDIEKTKFDNIKELLDADPNSESESAFVSIIKSSLSSSSKEKSKKKAKKPKSKSSSSSSSSSLIQNKGITAVTDTILEDDHPGFKRFFEHVKDYLEIEQRYLTYATAGSEDEKELDLPYKDITYMCIRVMLDSLDDAAAYLDKNPMLPLVAFNIDAIREDKSPMWIIRAYRTYEDSSRNNTFIAAMFNDIVNVQMYKWGVINAIKICDIKFEEGIDFKAVSIRENRKNRQLDTNVKLIFEELTSGIAREKGLNFIEFENIQADTMDIDNSNMWKGIMVGEVRGIVITNCDIIDLAFLSHTIYEQHSSHHGYMHYIVFNDIKHKLDEEQVDSIRTMVNDNPTITDLGYEEGQTIFKSNSEQLQDIISSGQNLSDDEAFNTPESDDASSEESEDEDSILNATFKPRAAVATIVTGGELKSIERKPVSEIDRALAESTYFGEPKGSIGFKIVNSDASESLTPNFLESDDDTYSLFESRDGEKIETPRFKEGGSPINLNLAEFDL